MGKRLYVGNLPYDADENLLREAFAQDGRVVERVHLVLDRETQRPRGFAFVEMATDEQARLAMEAMNGAVFGSRQLRVTEAEERRPGGGGPGGPGGPRGPGGPPRPHSGPPRSGPRPSGPGDAGDRGPRFGPDARPAHERQREADRRAAPRRRPDDGGSDDYGGRRGTRRFEDDDE